MSKVFEVSEVSEIYQVSGSSVVRWADALKYYFIAYMTTLAKVQTLKPKPMHHKGKPLQEGHQHKD